MKLYPTAYFIREYKKLTPQLQKKTDKALKFLLQNLHHPSLKAKKYDEKGDIWQARVDDNYRFYFLMRSRTYILLEVKSHPK
ncbi:MAG: hypothetical protein COT33_00415 [Candidatus Nealsonbacteria bacterium CG08_land_8_20_14_0_20_38_20]|uniref:Type II toxin-antitoxin system mRNA interferase toxin, RelE/StbE family n=1 Tax=Candidatus Nealsonbacteria bacterium CG08_land_8_20_14_0_20_38_20 TaxID=1974705 RepID=A0A2H0YPP5_9BACT|nr:MAG: hypothetical protein COT33_00415 [Candidatus Nealsonbacteria bacterium CG08_land_8_20_14_0_20_38_20]